MRKLTERKQTRHSALNVTGFSW